MLLPVEYLQGYDQALKILGSAASVAEDGDRELVYSVGLVNPWLIGAELADLFGIRSLGTGGITKFTAEGATFEKKSADWEALARVLRTKAGVAGADGHAFVVVPPGPLPRPELTGGFLCC